MNKLLVVLIAAAVASVAAAQTPSVPTSKEEKANLAKEASKANLNPENSSGAVATAAMQKKTTAESKATPKQNTELKSKEGKQELAKELQKNAAQ